MDPRHANERGNADVIIRLGELLTSKVVDVAMKPAFVDIGKKRDVTALHLAGTCRAVCRGEVTSKWVNVST